MPVRVLIVDDDIAFRQAVGLALTERGYLIVGEADTAAAARQAVSDLQPDAVLLDINLPDGNGISVAQALRSTADGPRILLTSTDPTAAPPRLVARSGASGFVAKTELLATDLSRYLD